MEKNLPGHTRPKTSDKKLKKISSLMLPVWKFSSNLLNQLPNFYHFWFNFARFWFNLGFLIQLIDNWRHIFIKNLVPGNPLYRVYPIKQSFDSILNVEPTFESSGSDFGMVYNSIHFCPCQFLAFRPLIISSRRSHMVT
jgi:uncharacterized protein (DUF3820 family)